MVTSNWYCWYYHRAGNSCNSGGDETETGSQTNRTNPLPVLTDKIENRYTQLPIPVIDLEETDCSRRIAVILPVFTLTLRNLVLSQLYKSPI